MATLVRQANSPYWYARFMVDGKDYWISTKTKNKKDATVIAEAEEHSRQKSKTRSGRNMRSASCAGKRRY